MLCGTSSGPGCPFPVACRRFVVVWLCGVVCRVAVAIGAIGPWCRVSGFGHTSPWTFLALLWGVCGLSLVPVWCGCVPGVRCVRCVRFHVLAAGSELRKRALSQCTRSWGRAASNPLLPAETVSAARGGLRVAWGWVSVPVAGVCGVAWLVARWGRWRGVWVWVSSRRRPCPKVRVSSSRMVDSWH